MNSLTDRTERAVLGALLTNPDVTALSYLQRTDFARTQHRSILAAIRTAHKVVGHVPGNRWLNNVAAASGTVVTTRELQDLQARCPVAGHANAYAGLVIEGRVRRAIAETADRITLDSGAFDFHAQRLGDLHVSSATMTTVLTRHMDALAHALKMHTEFDPGTWHPVQSAERSQPAPLPASPLAQAWQPRQWHEAPGPRARAEERVLTGLMQRHIDAPVVLAVVTPEMFTSPLRRCVYQTLQAMEMRGQPIDDITVEWELARRLSSAGSAQSVLVSHSETGPGYLTQLTRAPMGPVGMVVAAYTLAGASAPPAIAGPLQHLAPEGPGLRLIQPAPKPPQHPDGPAPTP